MQVRWLGAIILGASLTSALPACANGVKVWGLAMGTLCTSESGRRLPEDYAPKAFPADGEKRGLGTVVVGECHYDIRAVALEDPGPCPGASPPGPISPGTRGLRNLVRRGPHRSFCTP